MVNNAIYELVNTIKSICMISYKLNPGEQFPSSTGPIHISMIMLSIKHFYQRSHVSTACQYIMSVQHISTACQYSMSVQHVSFIGLLFKVCIVFIGVGRVRRTRLVEQAIPLVQVF